MFYKTCAFMLPDNIFAYVVMRCLSMCLPVTFVSCVKTTLCQMIYEILQSAHRPSDNR